MAVVELMDPLSEFVRDSLCVPLGGGSAVVVSGIDIECVAALDSVWRVSETEVDIVGERVREV